MKCSFLKRARNYLFMKKLTAFLIVSLTLLLCNNAKAQTLTPAGGVDKCGFDAIHQQLMQQPQYQQQMQSMEAHYMAYKNQAIQPKSIVNIPVVIHVMHTGEAVGHMNNPSDAQLISAINSLNDAFAGTGAYGSSAPTNVQFCLAQRDPSNNSTTGIVRYDASGITNYDANGCVNNGSSTNNVTQVKAASFWDNTKYYNIWVVKKINGSNGAGTQGYAQFPGGGGYNASDGTVILGNAMGYDPGGTAGYQLKSYTNLNTTLIHEIGHAFSLYHTFEGDNNGSSCPANGNCNTDGDRVCDIPPHIRSNSDCPADNTANGCEPGSVAGDFIHNFMDYSNESCTVLFSAGQATRVNATVANGGGRYSLTQSNGCDPVSAVDVGVNAILAPTASYCLTTITPKVTIKNFGSTTITSMNISYQIDGGPVTNFAWTGSLANSATEDVTLATATVTNGAHTFKAYTDSPNGLSDENSTNDTLSISFSISAASMPFVEQFEAGNPYPPTDWSIDQSPPHTDAWEQYTGAHGNGASTGISALIFTGTSLSGDKDMLISEPVSLANSNSPRLTFKVASKYFGFGTSNYDTLRVYVSEDCGATFNPAIYIKGGPALASMGPSNSAPGNYYPSQASDYRTDTVDLSAYNGGSVVLKFEHADHGGQNFFLDDINIQDPCQAFGDPTNIAGITSVCEDSTGVVYSISAVNEATGYVWSVPSDASISSGQGTTSITVNFGSVSDSIKVYATSADCGNSDTAFVEISIQSKPGNAGAIVGDQSACNGDTKTYSIPSATDATGYNWEVPSDWTIQSGANTNSIDVTVGASTGTVKVTPTNGCGTGNSSTLSVTVTPSPALNGTISGPTEVCPNATGQVYSITADPNATDYVWTVPSDASISGPANGTSITVDYGVQSGNITVKSQNACGFSNVVSLMVNVNSIPSVPDSIVGNRETCNGQTGVAYSVFTPVAGINYIWTVPAGSVQNAGASSDQITVDFGAASGNITVKAESACGQSLERVAAINVRDIPAMPGAITVQDTVCKNEAGVAASVALVPDADTYTWTLPNSAILVSGQGTNSISIDFTNAGGDIEVVASNLCGDSPASTKTVVMDSIPSAPGSINGNSDVCASSTNELYTVVAIPNATSYTWSVSPSASMLSPNGASSMQVNWNGNSGTIDVFTSNSCGSSAVTPLNVNVQPVTPAPDSIVGDRRVCQNESNVVYTIFNPDPAATYTWNIPSNITVVSQSNDTIILNYATTGGTLSVSADNGCGQSSLTNAQVQIHTAPVAPGVISTSNTVCENQSAIPASVATVNDAESYTWTVMADASIVSGQGTNNLTYDAGALSGSITVVAVNECGTSQPSSTSVTVKNVPSETPVIKGPSEVCISSTSEIYNVNAMQNATSYVWTIVGGGTINAGQGTQTVDVNWGGNPGQIKVQGQNTCGLSPEASMNVTIVTVTSPADSITGDTLVCPNETNVVYQVVTPQSGTAYSWTLPNGSVLTSGAGSASIQVDFGTNPGDIEVTADNGCGTSVPTTLNVNMSPAPVSAGTISGPTELCEGSDDVFSVTNNPDVIDYQWTIPNQSTLISGQGTNAISLTMGGSSGDVKVTPVYACGNGPSSVISLISRSMPQPVTSIVGDQEVCANESTVPYSVANDTNVSNYNWTVNGGAVISSGSGINSIAVDFSTQNVRLKVMAENICGSSDADSLDVLVLDPNVQADILGPDTVCAQSQAIDFVAANLPGTNQYSWTLPAGATLVSGAGTDSILVNFGSNGGDINLTMQNACGTYNATKTVAIGQAYSGNTAGVDTAFCESNPFTLVGGAISPANNYSYKWQASYNQAGPYSGAPGTNTQANYSSNSLAAGTVVYYRRIAKLYGCSDTSAIVAVTFEGGPQVLSTNLDTILCSNDALQIPPLNVQDGIIKSWTHDGLGQLDDPNIPMPLYQIDANDESSIVTFTMTIESTNSCFPQTLSEEFILLVNPDPVASGSGYEELCPTGLSIPIAGFSGSVSQVTWIQNGSGSFTDGNTYTPTYHTSMDDAGDSVLLQMIVSTESCATPISDTASYLIYLYPSIYDTSLQVYAGTDTTIFKGDNLILSGEAPQAIYTIWSPGTVVEDSLDILTFSQLNESTQFVLTAYSIQGCINRDTLFVEVRDLDTSIFVPYLITTNGDGVNDTWIIADLLTVSDVHVQVFNREGELVFEQEDYQHNWDGTMAGKKLPAATYYYLIEVPGMEMPLKGVISILQQ